MRNDPRHAPGNGPHLRPRPPLLRVEAVKCDMLLETDSDGSHRISCTAVKPAVNEICNCSGRDDLTSKQLLCTAGFIAGGGYPYLASASLTGPLGCLLMPWHELKWSGGLVAGLESRLDLAQ